MTRPRLAAYYSSGRSLGVLNLEQAKCVPIQRLPSAAAVEDLYPVTCACGMKLGGGAIVAAFEWENPLACPHCEPRLEAAPQP